MMAHMPINWKETENTGWVDCDVGLAALKGIESWMSTLQEVHSGHSV